MIRYTKGPWTAVRDDSHFGSLSTVEGGDTSDIWPGRELIVEVGGSGSEEQEGNTKIIAASSCMYEFMKRMQDEMVGLIGTDTYDRLTKIMHRIEG